MKCQKCEKPATFHITDLVDGKPNELHLCEECATSSSRRRRTKPTKCCRRWPGCWHSTWRSAKRPRSWPGSTSVLPGVRRHVSRIPQARPARLPARLRLLRRGAGAAALEHPRRDAARRQGAEVLRQRRRRADAADPPAPRNEGSGRRRRIRAGLASCATRSARSNKRGTSERRMSTDESTSSCDIRIAHGLLQPQLERIGQDQRRMAARLRPGVGHRHQQPHPAGPQPGRFPVHLPRDRHRPRRDRQDPPRPRSKRCTSRASSPAS